MAKRYAQATLQEYDDGGTLTKRSVRLSAHLCVSEEPQIFSISLPDKSPQRHQEIRITRAEIERVLSANPQELKWPPEG